MAEPDPDLCRIERPLVLRTRAALERAAAPTATIDERAWRAARDAWLDALDPASAASLPARDVIALVEFLGAATASRESRSTEAEWEREVSLAASALLSTVDG